MINQVLFLLVVGISAVAMAHGNPVVKLDVPNTANFLIQGDWGGQTHHPFYTHAQWNVAQSMARYAESTKISAAFFLGDNFYEEGLTAENRFEETYLNVYAQNSLQKMPIYAILGNHDYRAENGPQKEIAYSQEDPSGRWTMPSTDYLVQIKSSDWSLDVVMIDTIIMAGNNEFHSNGTLRTDEESRSLPPPGPADAQAAADQFGWIHDTLQSSTADYIIVAGHYPVYSGCEHGDTQVLQENLKPLLEQYGAHYMGGHEHCLEHIVVNNINYMVSGAAHWCCYQGSPQGLPQGSLEFAAWDGPQGVQIQGGWSSMTITKDKLQQHYYSESGNVLFSPSPISPRNQFSNSTTQEA